MMSTTKPRVSADLERRWYHYLAGALPFAMLATLGIIYAISPQFYLEYIIYWKQRENQAVEFITFTSAIVGAALLLVVVARLSRQPATRHQYWLGVLGITVIAAAALFFAGEEVSWGQHWFGWQTPDEYRDLSVETNLHNTDIPVQSLGSVFILLVFIALPIAWRFRDRLNLPGGLEPMIAEPPIVVCTIVGFIWKEFKNLYHVLVPDYEDVSFYIDFVEQINEHKEMLIAVALLLYGVYRLRWWRVG